MIDDAPRLLFIPVSGAFGMGEYARSLAVAQGVALRWPAASIRFVLSRAAPYAARVPFPATMLDSSPTFHSAAVARVIAEFTPDVVVFDNAGRSAQLRAAKRSGARVVYISARPRQRRKAFRLRWMTLIDEHWIAYPRFIAGELNFVERCKLRVMQRPVLRYLDVILDEKRDDLDGSVLRRQELVAGEFVLVVPGGGTGHPGAGQAVAEFLATARSVAAAGVVTVFVGGDASEASMAGNLRMPGSLAQADLAQLMRAARLIVANGGSTLIQAIACGRPCIAAPIAGDQGERIRRCVAAGVTLAATLDSAAMTRAAVALLGDAGRLDAMSGRAMALGLTDGVEVAVRALNSLLAARPA